jgi:tetratricopeptide (TPR) repeat protein
LLTRSLRCPRWSCLGHALARLVLVAWASVPGLAFAEAPSPELAERARALYSAGTRAFAEKRYSEAGQQFDQAASYVPSAIALFTAGLSWERAGNPVRAADDYAHALALATLDREGLDEKRARQAKERLQALEATLGTARVVGAPGSFAQIEGQGAPAPAELPAVLHGTAGGHVLLLRPARPGTFGSSDNERVPIILTAGETLQLDLTAKKLDAAAGIAAAPATVAPLAGELAATPGTPSHAHGKTLTTLGYAFIGASVAVEVATAIVWFGPAMAARDDYRDGAGTRNRAESYQTLTNVLLVGGAAVAAGGAALVLLGHTGSDARSTTLPSLGLHLGLGGAALAGAW